MLVPNPTFDHNPRDFSKFETKIIYTLQTNTHTHRDTGNVAGAVSQGVSQAQNESGLLSASARLESITMITVSFRERAHTLKNKYVDRGGRME